MQILCLKYNKIKQFLKKNKSARNNRVHTANKNPWKLWSYLSTNLNKIYILRNLKNNTVKLKWIILQIFDFRKKLWDENCLTIKWYFFFIFYMA